jgi:hypothetical protein
MSTQRDEDLARMAANTNDVVMFFMERFSRLVGKVLTNVEIAMPSDTRQYLMLKRALNRILYDQSRTRITDYFDGDLVNINYTEGLVFVQSVFIQMQIDLDSTLDMAFPTGAQHTAVKGAIKSSVDEVLTSIEDEFNRTDAG